ncbi:sporulation protein YtfJ [Alkalithermobacter thermoalcaliphilus JW-YL-7 = DSM 7308]|uniref:Sporulation protein YtfJ n=1 Tax=Alkalithermobacter thermoalcaliphilus JW-YL-7 = DSM 7308 TaxID=1121328 RepID=A0A150FQM6_CLOPD|nr:sporulation protein YtfJ [[Clostridium] paradoxum JW-YL-7 = DSM 7308]SHK77643.1 sporulation protein YtfJ [[Clostridium] paradoxum JW-YL-7 = DSM 7308]
MNNTNPIEDLMKTTMENMKNMIDVNTVIGDPIETSNGTIIIPISKVSFGFASGGGEYIKGKREKLEEIAKESYPFAGGTGAGISVQPVGFMIVSDNETKLIPVDQNITMVDTVLNTLPKVMEKIQSILDKGKQNNKDEEGIH